MTGAEKSKIERMQLSILELVQHPEVYTNPAVYSLLWQMNVMLKLFMDDNN